MINLPNYIKESVVLSDQDKEVLAHVSRLPTEIEVDEIRSFSFIQELMNAFIGDETTRDTHLQLKAKEYLAIDDVDMAWKILLLD
ncbi:hypothetical protein [Sphingobacterium rhinopitheci]|uniref:hypothetical protein n=1 Tax=Sphingobacterium rhinopitheci TaxID=2781960 RepID=UPI001F517394|nr:hypothetical protein [Sphingobacterium rhinopitheci]MCI0919744.1 hypothetical protein [Sphingobacterium rhinopitheci]